MYARGASPPLRSPFGRRQDFGSAAASFPPERQPVGSLSIEKVLKQMESSPTSK